MTTPVVSMNATSTKYKWRRHSQYCTLVYRFILKKELFPGACGQSIILWSRPMAPKQWGQLCPQEIFANVCRHFSLSRLGLGERPAVQLNTPQCPERPPPSKESSHPSVRGVYRWMEVMQHNRTKLQAHLYAVCQYGLTRLTWSLQFCMRFFSLHQT